MAKARYLTFLGFLVIVLGVGFTIGLTIRPGEWYQSLEKPFFTPPNWLFGPAWSIIYVLIAIAGWRISQREGFRSSSFGFWWMQMLLNWMWTPIFFGAHLIATGLALIGCLLGVILTLIWKTIDRKVFWCLVPSALWVAYASSLNLAIFILNL